MNVSAIRELDFEELAAVGGGAEASEYDDGGALIVVGARKSPTLTNNEGAGSLGFPWD